MRHRYSDFDTRVSHRCESDRVPLIEDRASRALLQSRALLVERNDLGLKPEDSLGDHAVTAGRFRCASFDSD